MAHGCRNSVRKWLSLGIHCFYYSEYEYHHQYHPHFHHKMDQQIYPGYHHQLCHHTTNNFITNNSSATSNCKTAIPTDTKGQQVFQALRAHVNETWSLTLLSPQFSGGYTARPPCSILPDTWWPTYPSSEDICHTAPHTRLF